MRLDKQGHLSPPTGHIGQGACVVTVERRRRCLTEWTARGIGYGSDEDPRLRVIDGQRAELVARGKVQKFCCDTHDATRMKGTVQPLIISRRYLPTYLFAPEGRKTPYPGLSLTDFLSPSQTTSVSIVSYLGRQSSWGSITRPSVLPSLIWRHAPEILSIAPTHLT